MKKQIHILQGISILTIILILSLLTVKFIYYINQEKVDTDYMWNIKLNNIIINKDSKNCKTTINDNILSTEVILEQENDFYEFTFDIENNGSLSAELSEMTLGIDNPKNILTYQISYTDNSPINKGDIIESNSKKTILVRVEYPHQPEKIYDALSLTLTINLKYIAIY